MKLFQNIKIVLFFGEGGWYNWLNLVSSQNLCNFAFVLILPPRSLLFGYSLPSFRHHIVRKLTVWHLIISGKSSPSQILKRSLLFLLFRVKEWVLFFHPFIKIYFSLENSKTNTEITSKNFFNSDISSENHKIKLMEKTYHFNSLKQTNHVKIVTCTP